MQEEEVITGVSPSNVNPNVQKQNSKANSLGTYIYFNESADDAKNIFQTHLGWC